MTFHEAICYSLDPRITKKDLQEHKEIFYDTKTYTILKEWMKKHHIWAFFAQENKRFKRVKSIPYLVYYLGDLSLLDKNILGVVGPRKMSAYGKNVLEHLFSYIADYDVVTISGMAEGVDQLCHRLSMQCGVPTIAVLGWGLWWYARRPEWQYIQQIVAAGGLVLSEFRLGEQPNTYTFPQRNRIIAGLCNQLFLPEASKKSWSLITVDCALSIQTPVYAPPSSIFSPTSEWILQLIESGQVKPVVDLKRFLYHHFPQKDTPARIDSPIELTDEEHHLLAFFSRDQELSLPYLAHLSGLEVDTLIHLLTILEIRWLLYQNSPNTYCLV
jgi:DNA processing protein